MKRFGGQWTWRSPLGNYEPAIWELKWAPTFARVNYLIWTTFSYSRCIYWDKIFSRITKCLSFMNITLYGIETYHSVQIFISPVLGIQKYLLNKWELPALPLGRANWRSLSGVISQMDVATPHLTEWAYAWRTWNAEGTQMGAIIVIFNRCQALSLKCFISVSLKYIS